MIVGCFYMSIPVTWSELLSIASCVQIIAVVTYMAVWIYFMGSLILPKPHQFKILSLCCLYFCIKKYCHCIAFTGR